MFKTELHCHSIDASPCSTESVESLVEIYAKAGYDTVILTNHFCDSVREHYGCKSVSEYVDFFVEAGEKMKRSAQGKLEVVISAELRFNENFNDYLWFGFDPEYIKNNPDIFELGVTRFHEVCKERGWLLVQAHPFRTGMRIISPKDIDGVEVYNGHIGHESKNFLAMGLATEYNLIKTSGTDLHYARVPATGGILTNEKITSQQQLISVLKSGLYELLTTDLVR